MSTPGSSPGSVPCAATSSLRTPGNSRRSPTCVPRRQEVQLKDLPSGVGSPGPGLAADRCRPCSSRITCCGSRRCSWSSRRRRSPASASHAGSSPHDVLAIAQRGQRGAQQAWRSAPKLEAQHGDCRGLWDGEGVLTAHAGHCCPSRAAQQTAALTHLGAGRKRWPTTGICMSLHPNK